MNGINKRGSLFDVIFIVAIIFTMAIVFPIGWKLMSSVNTQLQGQSGMTAQGKALVQSSTDRYVSTFDGIFITALVLLWVAAVVGAFLVDVNPAFYFISVIILSFIVGIAALLSNTFQTMSSSDLIGSSASDFSILSFVMNNYPLYVVFLGFSVLIALYAKGESAGGSV